MDTDSDILADMVMGRHESSLLKAIYSVVQEARGLSRVQLKLLHDCCLGIPLGLAKQPEVTLNETSPCKCPRQQPAESQVVLDRTSPTALVINSVPYLPTPFPFMSLIKDPSSIELIKTWLFRFDQSTLAWKTQSAPPAKPQKSMYLEPIFPHTVP